MERNKIKEQETNFLIEESKKNPGLFERQTFIDSPDFLEKIGIFFGNDKALPRGYLKLWPQDFIVEEKSMYGVQETVDFGNLFLDEKNFLRQDPTIYATLVKCNLPTFEATRDLAKNLGVEPEKIKSAGIKDTDAITSQLISMRGVDVEKLRNISSPYYFLKNVYSGKGVAEIGSLIENKFTILIRTNSSFDKQQFNRNLEKIRKNGFFNFFYLQRFGSPRFINWFWGLLILRGEYENAVTSFLCSEGQREILYFKKIREKIKKNLDDWDKVLEIIEPFPIVLQNEIKVVKYLRTNPKDFTGALQQITDQVQLWVYAYGSLLFNRKLSDYVESTELVPENLPLILSDDKNDWLLYRNFLAEDKISTIPLRGLVSFPGIQWKKRQVKTKEKVDIHKIEFIPEGIILSFSLAKGCYATTFLTHLFKLETGLPPKDISGEIVDIKKLLGDESIQRLTERFKAITFSKKEDIFGKSE